MGRLKPQLQKQNPPARVTLREGFAYRTVDFPSVRDGELCLYSREFHSPGLKLTPMHGGAPLRELRG